MTIEFRPAVRESCSLFIGLAGPTGSGKTYSALRLATGLTGNGGKIFVIDTEARRALHYADKFKFQHADLRPPFTPDRCREAVVTADQAGADVIIFDSMSHEHAGEGGLLEWADKIGETMKNPDNAAKWNKPKTSHKRMVNRFLQCRAHLIFCLRAEEKLLMKTEVDERTGRRKTIVIAAQDRPLEERWHPICEKNFMFEMTCSFLLLHTAPGIPIPIKLQEQHKPAFDLKKPLDESSGTALAEWAGSGRPGPEKKPDDSPDPSFDDGLPPLKERAETQAEKGIEALQIFWDGLGRDDKVKLKPDLEDLKATAKKADEQAA